MLGNYLQRAIEEIRVARSELPYSTKPGYATLGRCSKHSKLSWMRCKT